MEEKTYFLPGDVVTIRLRIPNSPKMIVVKRENYIFKLMKEKTDLLKGIKCRWFTTSGELQEAVFNTKDLIKLKYD